MIDIGFVCYFMTIALTVALTSIGVGIGGGIAATATLEALNIQPKASSEIQRVSILGMALIETSGVLGVVISLMLFFQIPPDQVLLATGVSTIGVLLALGGAGCIVGIVSAFPVTAACSAVARQPFFTPRIINFMLLTLSLIQTPLIFAFLVSLLIITQQGGTVLQSIHHIAAGLAIGLGSIGPSLGLARFARQACKGLGINRESYAKLLPFTFISMAIIETPLVFSLLIALLLIGQRSTTFLTLFASCAAALCMGIGTIGSGIGSAQTAIAAAHQISYNPHDAGVISKVSMIAQALIDAAAIYALLVALLIIFLH